MLRKFVQADIAAIYRHRLWIGGERNNARAGVELDHADFHVLCETGGPALFIESIERDAFLPVAYDRAGKVKQLRELVALPDIFQRAGIIFRREEIIAAFEPKPFSDVLERIGVG